MAKYKPLKNIRRWERNYHKTDADIARVAGLHETTIRNVVTGVSPHWSYPTLVKIHDALATLVRGKGLTIGQIMDLERYPRREMYYSETKAGRRRNSLLREQRAREAQG